MDSLIAALTKILEVKTPWIIEKIDVHSPTKTVNVFISFETGSKFSCSQCNKMSTVYDSNYRVWRHLDLCDYRCYLNIKIPRTKCTEHGVKVISHHPFGRQDIHYSFKLEALIMAKAKTVSIRAMSLEIGEPDNNLWRVIHHYVKQGIAGIICDKTTIIGVDEKSYKKGHKYVSVFTDLETGSVIYVCQGRDESVFARFYEELFNLCGDPNFIKKISMDMSKSYISGQKEHFPGAEVFFDKFHIKKGINEAVDKVRKQEVVHTENLKKTKYIWLKNKENLTEEQKKKLAGFLEESTTNTAKAYKLKTAFDQLWNIQQHAIEPTLNQWLKMAEDLALKPLISFAKTIKNHYKGVVNSMKSLINNALSEGLNSVFQLSKYRARGYRNVNNFINMTYLLGNDFKFSFH